MMTTGPFPKTPDAKENEARNAGANACTQRGIALLESDKPEDLLEALRLFDEAIELRKTLPLKENPWFLYGLIAGWLNRGDALTRLGSPQQLDEAVQSYDQALGFLGALPLDRDPQFRRRLALAWINRAFPLRKQATEASRQAALRSLEQAISLLLEPACAKVLDRTLLLAGAWMNRGTILLELDTPDAAGALAAAREARTLIRTWEKKDLLAAETGFKARQVLCRAAAHLLTEKHETLVAEATDAVEEGIGLGRHWEAKGENRFRPLVQSLFHFGCRAYQVHQPHFLAEFILENVQPAGGPLAQEDHGFALESLWRALGALQQKGFRSVATPEFSRILDSLRDLQVAEARLLELQSKIGPHH
jgi:tetratricopeptide (TPR) repeat protein